MADRYLLESGAPDGYLLEDGSGVLILEAVTATITGGASYNYAGSGTVNVALKITGGASQSYAGSGTVKVALKITGGASYSYAGSGTIKVALTITGGASYGYAGSGIINVTAAGATITGAASYSYASSGTVKVSVKVTGSASYSYTSTGTIKVALKITGGASYSYAGSGTLTSGSGAPAVVVGGGRRWIPEVEYEKKAKRKRPKRVRRRGFEEPLVLVEDREVFPDRETPAEEATEEQQASAAITGVAMIRYSVQARMTVYRDADDINELLGFAAMAMSLGET